MAKYIISIRNVGDDYVDLSFEKKFTAKDDKKAIDKFNKDKIKIQEDCLNIQALREVLFKFFIDIQKTERKNIIKKLELKLNSIDASYFCSCYEGDLYNKYEKSIKELIYYLEK